MNKQNETKILGGEETSTLLDGVTFYSQMAVIPLRGEKLSSEQRKGKDAEYTVSSSYKNLVGLSLLVKLCEGQTSLIEKQATLIKELQGQLADYEQELYDISGNRLVFESSCMEDMI